MISVKLILRPYPSTNILIRRRYWDEVKNLIDSVIDILPFFFFGADALVVPFSEDIDFASSLSIRDVLR
jgi:hypothetical protein